MFEHTYYWIFGESLVALGVVSLVSLGLTFEAGFWCGQHNARRKPDRDGVSVISASMMALLSITLGMTISYAQERYESRRGFMVQEANAIGTAWLRANLIGGDEGPAIGKKIEELARLELAATVVNASEPDAVLADRRGVLQDQIWALAQTRVRRDPSYPATVTMSAINDMFDSELTERFEFEGRVPLTLSCMLLGGAILAIGAMGYQFGLTGSRHPLLVSLLLVMWTGGMVLTVDLSRPRAGSIHIDPTPLLWTIKGFGPPSPAY